MSPQAENFLARLRGRARKGVRLLPETYRGAFAEVCPTLTADEFRSRLSSICQELEAEGHVSLPRSERLYDRAGSAKLPAWIDLSKVSPAAEALPVDPVVFPWAPELRFACDIRDARSLGILLRIQGFLSDGGRSRPMVPAKERSVELFGDEKRLERLRNGTLFGTGRITLEMLRCFIVLPPLVFEALKPTQNRRPVLVLENYSTYHSFARWNQCAQVYEAVLYGHGDSFETAAAGLAEVTREMSWDSRAFYFGDLDVKGVLIPVAASETLQSTNLPRLLPHSGCYRRLLERANKVHLPTGEPSTLPSRCHEWLGDELAQETDAWLRRGVRLPQELIGWEELSKSAQTFALPVR